MNGCFTISSPKLLQEENVNVEYIIHTTGRPVAVDWAVPKDKFTASLESKVKDTTDAEVKDTESDSDSSDEGSHSADSDVSDDLNTQSKLKQASDSGQSMSCLSC